MRAILLALSLCLVLVGCQSQSSQKGKVQSTPKQGAQTNQKQEAQSAEKDPACTPTPVRYQEKEQQAMQIAAQVHGIEKVVAVQIDDELDVAIKVTNFNRLKLESIEKDVSKRLKEAFPRTHVHVTSDKKLIMELQKLNETPWSAKPEDACKQKKQIKKIEKQMKG